jgi:hypothetical protein
VDSSRTPLKGIRSIDGANQPVEMEAVTHRRKPLPWLGNLLKRPVFITFLKKTSP